MKSPPFHPASRIEDQSLPWGWRYSFLPNEREIASLIRETVVDVVVTARPPCYHGLERTDRTMNPILSCNLIRRFLPSDSNFRLQIYVVLFSTIEHHFSFVFAFVDTAILSYLPVQKTDPRYREISGSSFWKKNIQHTIGG